MVSIILFVIWLILIVIPMFIENEVYNDFFAYISWIVWILLSLVWIIPIFTGVNIKNSEGQYKGYVTAVEKNGTYFVGYTAYLKSDLTSSNEDVACIDRNNTQLIEEIKKAQENKENIVMEYESVWQYKIGECPGSSFKIIRIK